MVVRGVGQQPVNGSSQECTLFFDRAAMENTMEDWTGTHLGLAKCACPYCGSPIQLVIDPLQVGCQYIEDCEVCCRPMLVTAVTEEEAMCEIEG